jgi:hypothetical protein
MFKPRFLANLVRRGIGPVVCAAVSGCAGVNFYSDAALTKKTGIPIYGSKPYLMVVRTQAEDKPVEVSIQYLPDPSKVIYAEPTSGFGSANLTLSLTQGQMTAFGQETDTKVPELLGAVTGLITGRATAAKTLAEAGQIKAGKVASTAQGAELLKPQILADIKSLRADLDGAPFKAEATKLDSSQLATVDGLKLALDAVIKYSAKPEDKALLDAAVAALPEASKPFMALPEPPAIPSSASSALIRIKEYKKRLGDIVKALTPPKEEQDTFELYEILQDASGGVTALRRVK